MANSASAHVESAGTGVVTLIAPLTTEKAWRNQVLLVSFQVSSRTNT